MTITNIHKNIMGTTSFNLKVGRMRKHQKFVVYPLDSDPSKILIQSDKMMGVINLADRSVTLANGKYYAQYIASKKLTHKVDLVDLIAHIHITSGEAVGSSRMMVRCDNSEAKNV